MTEPMMSAATAPDSGSSAPGAPAIAFASAGIRPMPDVEEAEPPTTDELATTATATAAATATATEPEVGFMAEMKAGYQFLRTEPTLFANTIQASVAQLNVGVLTALMSAYALAVFGDHEFGPKAVYGLIESSVGLVRTVLNTSSRLYGGLRNINATLAIVGCVR